MSNMETGSGLPDSFDFKITDATFGVDARINDGKSPMLMLDGLNSETEKEDHVWLKIGNTWEIVAKGARIEYTGSSKSPKINGQTAYGRWIDSFMKVDGADEVVKDLGMDAWVADSWVGLTLHLERREHPFTIDGEQVVQKYFDVTDIVGAVVKDTAADPAPADTDEPEAPTADAPPASASDGGDDAKIPAPVKAKLTKLAKNAGSFEAFIDQAYENIEGLDGAAWESEVTDDGDTGYYETHKG